MKASEFIRRGIERIKTHGWWQGQYFGPDGRCCMLGSLMIDGVAVHKNPDSYYAARKTITNVIFETEGVLATKYNDAPDRTKTQVLRKMGQAARRLEKEGR